MLTVTLVLRGQFHVLANTHSLHSPSNVCQVNNYGSSEFVLGKSSL
jgi:hypothetical protein